MKEKNVIGRPSHEPTDRDRAQVKMMSAVGLPHEDIAKIVGITAPTLRKHFREELDTGAAEANAKVAQSLFRQATNTEKPNVVAAIFWLKARAGWRDHDDQNGKPGKKETQKDAAGRAAAGHYSATQPPRLIVNNASKA